jgi:glycosyltransferase involved in cell wall biosynthesis
MSAPFFSVIVTTHRRPQLLARALQSVSQQTFQEFEIILCADEGSRETRSAANEGLRDTDVFLCRPGAKGPAASRNMGLALARGENILFLDDDDTFEPSYFATLAERLQTGPAPGVLYTNFTVITESRGPQGILCREARHETKRGLNLKRLWVGNFISNNSVAIAACLAKRTSVDEHLRSHEDWDYLLGLLSITDFEHLDVLGPRVHISDNALEHRNERVKRNREIGLDFLAIYRKWPASDEPTRVARVEELKALGLYVNPAAM